MPLKPEVIKELEDLLETNSKLTQQQIQNIIRSFVNHIVEKRSPERISTLIGAIRENPENFAETCKDNLNNRKEDPNDMWSEFINKTDPIDKPFEIEEQQITRPRR